MNRSVFRYVKISAILALILFIVFSIYIGKYLLTFINDPEMFRNWIDSFGIYAPLAYCGVTILQILFPLIPGEPMEMIAGYAFGSLQGTLLCILAESLGSILVLLAVKKYGRKIVEIFFEKEKIDSLKFLRSDSTGYLKGCAAFDMHRLHLKLDRQRSILYGRIARHCKDKALIHVFQIFLVQFLHEDPFKSFYTCSHYAV